ncbi:MAG TPA: WecB/TagA/CpsF family glycosyltransferase [Kiritimatiellia bacterium]|nr:WecB/TagA/CpsF family glycosyltransferase [Kiritimatiellia bacterium]
MAEVKFNPSGRVAMGPVSCSMVRIRDLLGMIRETLTSPSRKGFSINLLNAHLYNLSWTNRDFRELVNRSDIIAADGMAIVWASRLFGAAIPERCNMTDSFRAYLADATMPHATAVLIGCSKEEAARAAETMQRDCPRLRVTHALSGYMEPAEYVVALKALPATDFVLLGMGSPKSEIISHLARDVWPESIVWHIGGGTILFFAGTLVEAPLWMRKCGLQWLHRLLMEPRRMWRRYLIGNPLFIARILKSAFSTRPPKSA